MRSILPVLGLFLAGFVLSFPMSSAMANNAITVDNVHAFQTVTVQKNGAVYFSVENKLDEADRIIGAEAQVSEIVELHTHLMDDGIMMMRKVEAYDVPARGKITLQPMGDHVMLINLKSPLKVGNSFPMTLIF